MEDLNSKQKNMEKKSNNTKNSSKNKSKFCVTKNELITNKVNKNILKTKENEHNYIKSKFYNKLNIIKDKEIDDLNKPVKENNFKTHISSNSDKKNIQKSVSQDLISKILEINNTDSSHKKDGSNFFFDQKEETFSNNINSIRTNKISVYNNTTIKEYREESTISIKKNGNNKIQETLSNSKNKNIQDIYKNNVNVIHGAGTQDFRKQRNIKLDSFNDRQSENDFKYNSSITSNMRSHLKKTDILFGLNQLSESDSNQQLTFRLHSQISQNNLINIPSTQRSNLKNNNNEIMYCMSKKQKEIAQSISGLDFDKLKKEIYEYENTDITDAISKLPDHKFESDKNNNKNNKHKNKRFKRKNNKRKKIKKEKKNIRGRFRVLRRVGYVYDSLDDEECEDEEDNNFYFEPNSKFISILDSIILIISLLDLVFLPIHLSSSPFNEKNLIKGFIFIFTDIVFIIDFVSGFFKAYYNFDEDLIINSVLIIKNYLNTWFLLDLLCGIPVYSILKIIENKLETNNCYESSCYFNYSGRNLYQLFELFKLLKIMKALKSNIAKKRIELKIKKISFFYYWGRFIKQVIIFTLILNLSSCLFIFSARNSYPNWILNSNMNMHNFISIYICSFYYMITTTTTVGYGDIQIYSMTERIFEIFFLIIGTCLYSWMLTSASNYIKKIDEKDTIFEQKIEILDEIKKNYPLMSNDLYRRVYKLLYYKKCHEEVDKNIIIDSLPYSIKNNLLIQMYYPIITNFKFFKYFGNSEFIIEIVSVLKPLVCLKGDLLINEGDHIEDIIFNKSGILSIDIRIDLNNPNDFIKQYLTKYNLENIKNKKSLDSSLNSSNFSKSSLISNKINNSTIKPNIDMTFLMSIKHEKSTLKKERIKNKFQYLKILSIREKEHFGDVLMFLNEPSPLNVRVNSKNAEVLLLSKTDVVKISSNFPNIWKKINQKSIFNLEQIKNIIMRKLSIFCISNGIKIKSLYYKKDTKTGQNKLGYTLIPIPDSSKEEISNENIILNETNDNISKNSENNFSQNSENYNENNTYIIKEVQSSDESGTNSIKSKKNRYSYGNNAMSKKESIKKMSDSINISNQKECNSDKNIRNKRNNKYNEQNTENRNQFLIHSKSYSNFSSKKNSVYSNKNSYNSLKTNQLNVNANIDNTIFHGNYSSKNSRISYLSYNPIMNINISTISLTKGAKQQNFDEKNKMNKKLVSTHSFNFMESYNNYSNNRSEEINDEIYSNENFEIKIPDNDQNLINNNNIESQKQNISNCAELSAKLLISDKKIIQINSIKKEDKYIDNYNCLKPNNNKFDNLKITSMSTLEIKSSYDNLNEFTKYRLISDSSLVNKTKIFLSKECDLLNNINKRFSHHQIKKSRIKSKSTMKVTKYLHNFKFYEHANSINDLSTRNYNNNIQPSSSKEIKKVGSKKNKKENEKIFENSLKNIKRSNKSFGHINRNSTIKEENKLFKKVSSTCDNVFSSFSPNKERRTVDISSDNLVNLKTRNKLDLITKNMERDSQNLNNPNEFYANLFNNFYKKKVKKKESLPKIKKTQNSKGKDDSVKGEEEKEENI